MSGKYPDGKTNSVLLKEKIDDLAKNSPTGKVDVIAHSLGGLVTKQYIINNDNPKIDKLIFVGVPIWVLLDRFWRYWMGQIWEFPD